MANKVYTETEFKTMIMDRVNDIQKLNVQFVTADADEGFDSAVRECGYDLPVTGDDDIDQKNEWLKRRMVYWFYFTARERNLLLIGDGDLKASSVPDRLTQILKEMDLVFEKARTSDATARLFLDSTVIFGDDPMVVDSGYVQDSVGQDTSKYDTGSL